MFRFLHAADIHLDSPLRGLERYEGAPVEEIRGATRRAFDNLIELAIEQQVQFVVLAGDLYDGDWKDYNTGLYFVDRMARLCEADIPVFLITGNHDAASQITRHLRLPDNVTKFSDRHPERALLDDLGVALHGQGFATRSVTEDLTQAYPQGDPQLFNIGLLHTCLDGKPGHDPYAPCTIDGLRSKGYQYWALGHVHAREEVCDDPWIVFPGNLQGRHIRETGSKGCVLVTVDNHEVQTVELRSLDVLRWSSYLVELGGTESTDDVYDRVLETMGRAAEDAAGRPVAVRIRLSGASHLHARLRAEFEHFTHQCRGLATSLSGAGVWLEKVVLTPQPPVARGDLENRADALSGLLRAIRELELGAEAPQEFSDSIGELRQKLPPELLAGDDGFDPTEPDQLKALLDDVKEILTTRLLAGDHD